jgi:uncharacterized protein (TIGR02246 family)
MTEGASNPKKTLDEMQQAWNSAAKVWNPKALASLYADNALFYGGRSGHSVGAAAVQAYFASYDGIIQSAVLDLIEQELVETSPETFVSQGFGAFSFVLAGGRQTQSVLRTTLVLSKLNGQWKIQLHHFSVTPEVPPLGDA